MSIGIAPALEPDEWKYRCCGAVSLDPVDGEIASVSGTEEVFALMAR